MREIKFRAWNTNRKEMLSAEEMGKDELTLNPDGRGFVNVSSTSVKFSQYMNHIIPLQFTGLKDKNGKEIYEGDILKSDDISGVVYFDEESAGYRFDWNCIFNKKNCEHLEVIGNKFENPEFLK